MFKKLQPEVAELVVAATQKAIKVGDPAVLGDQRLWRTGAEAQAVLHEKGTVSAVSSRPAVVRKVVSAKVAPIKFIPNRGK